MNAIIINYNHDGYKGQFFATGSLYETLADLHNRLGIRAESGAIATSSGICGKFSFNFILN
jgi:hypothetical protein